MGKSKNPIKVILTYPNDAKITSVIDHLTTLGKSYGAPHIEIESPEADDYVKSVIEKVRGRGIKINEDIAEDDKARFSDDYDCDPSEPIVMGNTQGAATIEQQRAKRVNENVVAVTEDERAPPSTPTAGREARAERGGAPEAPRENPGFTVDAGESVQERVQADRENPNPTTEARPDDGQ